MKIESSLLQKRAKKLGFSLVSVVIGTTVIFDLNIIFHKISYHPHHE